MKLILGDCLEEMEKLIGGGQKVDLILTDLPYGTTQCKWDNIIPFEPMWECVHRLCKERTPTIFFNSEPFGSHLRMSNLKDYRYDLIWDKTKGTNFLNANRMPMPSHENISVFYKKLPCYNPQKVFVGKKYNKIRKGGLEHNTYNDLKKHSDYIDDGYRYPLSVIKCNKSKSEANNAISVHPTQKPVRLLEWLIKTYSNEGDVVLDFTMGSGSTGVACRNTNRDFIGIELDEDYFQIAKDRIYDSQTKLM